MTAVVAERRRLLIHSRRLRCADEQRRFVLEQHESRYLRKVLRLRPGDQVDVTDGCGHLWTARLLEDHRLELCSGIEAASQQVAAPSPKLGLAIAVIRRGMDDVMRMACELGVDQLQPIHCQRCVPQAEHRPDRWRSIVQEAVEQCERLWAPELPELRAVDDWWEAQDGHDLRLIAVARAAEITPLSVLLADQASADRSIWLAIGPEGGWSEQEIAAAAAAGWVPVSLGDTILRSSTAAVAGIASLTNWRTLRC